MRLLWFRLQRSSPARAVALLAPFVALGGRSYAAVQRPQPRNVWCVALIAATVAAVASVAVASTAVAAFPGKNGRIAVGFFGHCIKTMNPNGAGVRTLIGCERGRYGGSVSAAMPEWSPDGRRLLFLRDRGQPALMAADGSNRHLVRLAGDSPFWSEFKPSFAPDGRHFASVRSRPDDPLETGLRIWKVATDGREDRQLRAGWLPRWSPNGTTIAYVDEKRFPASDVLESGRRTWLMNARSGKRLRAIGPEASSLDWSPDGRQLLYTPMVCCLDIDTDIFVVSADGEGAPRRLTHTRSWAEGEAVWSPDGRRIAYVRKTDIPGSGGEGVKYQVLTMNREGGDRRLIYNSGVVISELIISGITLSWGARQR
jgi:Tol biopolymer transport system component